ncbi:MAG TPA: WecB/TagA/CpsF family glycosyltransferase, partial [Thermoflexales bacterium]|nr:WecB/TagA/CpsF family glycosyltransferase [Thermoflexales bacterium]
MDAPSKFAVLNVGVNPVAFQETLDILFGWISRGEKKYLSLCNAYTVTEAYDAPQVGQIINGSDLAVADGMPLVWMAHALGYTRAERIYGPDLMLALCEQGQSRGVKHYFYGATPDVLAEL